VLQHKNSHLKKTCDKNKGGRPQQAPLAKENAQAKADDKQN